MALEQQGRRRSGRRAGSRIEQCAARLPRLELPWKPLDILSDETLQGVIAGAMEILEEAGLEIRSARARAIYKKHGCLVDEDSQIVRMGRDIVMSLLRQAPESFVIHARDPDLDLHVGGNVINFAPMHGAPHVSDLAGGRRYGTLQDFKDVSRLNAALGVNHFRTAVLVEPIDLPVPERHLDIYRTHAETAASVWAARGLGRVPAEDALALSAVEHGTSLDNLAERPTLLTVTNVNSPRRVDEEILENLIVMAEHGQCVCITPFTLMGAMAPITLPGALVQQTAEGVGIIALVQMVRPGCPSVLGTFTSNVDMKTGSPAFGTPEFVLATLAGAQIGRALRLPVRAGAPCGSPAPDAQAAYETSFSLWAAIMGGCHLITHTTGWIENGLTVSLEKIVIDAEMLRSWATILAPRKISDGDFALDAIKATPPGGHYFGAEHTLARYETAFWRPVLSSWANFENWRDAGAKDATTRAHDIAKRLIAEYSPPQLTPAVAEAIDEFVARRRAELRSRD